MHRHADARVVDLADHYSASCRLEQGEYVRCSLEEVPGGGTTRSNVNLPNRSSQSTAFPILGRAPPGIKRQAREGGGASWQNAFI